MSPEAPSRGAGGKGKSEEMGSGASIKSASVSSLGGIGARRSLNASPKRALSSSPVFKPIQEMVDDALGDVLWPQEHQQW